VEGKKHLSETKEEMASQNGFVAPDINSFGNSFRFPNLQYFFSPSSFRVCLGVSLKSLKVRLT
jgi:hypothetical protein